MRTLNDLRKALEIDKHLLDDELVRQPQLYADISDVVRNATIERDVAKEKLTRTDALIYERIAASEEKISDAKILRRIVVEDAHIEAQDELIEAQAGLSEAMSLLTALEHKASALRKLADLYVSGYWSTATSSTGAGANAAARSDRDAEAGRQALASERRERRRL